MKDSIFKILHVAQTEQPEEIMSLSNIKKMLGDSYNRVLRNPLRNSEYTDLITATDFIIDKITKETGSSELASDFYNSLGSLKSRILTNLDNMISSDELARYMLKEGDSEDMKDFIKDYMIDLKRETKRAIPRVDRLSN